jgi:hypothetical protein
MSLMRAALIAILASGVFDCAGAPPPLPQNTLACSDFTKNADGTWNGHRDQAPFDIAPQKQIKITGDIRPGKIKLYTSGGGNIDVWALIEAKCGTGR